MTPMLFLLLGIAIPLAGFALYAKLFSFRAQRPEAFLGKGPRFVLRQHLNGPILCEGVIYGLLGRVTSRFIADMDVHWDGNVGVMTEHFLYDNGTVQDRRWTLRLDDDGHIHAEAPDVIGAGSGRVVGPAVQLFYRIQLGADAGGHVLDVVDWMYLMENGTIINRSQFSKFGIKVAELVATMRPVVAA
ncbi:MAG: DUF3833 domain-containing protein [Paracoccaceae bacterium]